MGNFVPEVRKSWSEALKFFRRGLFIAVGGSVIVSIVLGMCNLFSTSRTVLYILSPLLLMGGLAIFGVEIYLNRKPSLQPLSFGNNKEVPSRNRKDEQHYLQTRAELRRVVLHLFAGKIDVEAVLGLAADPKNREELLAVCHSCMHDFRHFPEKVEEYRRIEKIIRKK